MAGIKQSTCIGKVQEITGKTDPEIGELVQSLPYITGESLIEINGNIEELQALVLQEWIGTG